MRAAVLSALLGLTVAAHAHAAPPAVFVRPPSAPTDEARWFELRAQQRIAEHFETFGVLTTQRGAEGLPEIEVVCTPAEIDRSRDEVTISLVVHASKRTKHQAKGRASALDALTAKVALAGARDLGIDLPEGVEALAPAWRYPFSVHRFLGRASVRMWRGEHRQAALMFGRAQELVEQVWVPEAFEGRRRAEAYLVSLAGADPNEKRDLATSAAERAEIALERRRPKDALHALESFLRYVPERARRWTLAVPFREGEVSSRRTPWAVTLPGPPNKSADALWRVDPRTGVITRRDPGRPGLVDLAQGDLVTLDGRTLSRHDVSGAQRWSLRLPATPRPGGTVSTSGLLGVLSANEVAWADLSIGELGQVARGVEPLGAGVGGVVVRIAAVDAGGAPDLALLRPGKKTPAWRHAVPGASQVELTRDRVVVVADAGLVLLRSHDGRPVRDPIPLGTQARLLCARGRYAAIAEEQGTVAIVDVLAAERTATVRGPGAPVAAQTTATGLAVLFEAQDLVFYDRDGKRLDRAFVPGHPRGLRAGSPATPGPVAITDLGLFAYAEVDGRARLERDIDGSLAAAEALLASGNTQAALRLATEVAMVSAGRIGDAEDLRAKALSSRTDPASKAAAARAKARAERARSTDRAVGAFSL